MFKRILSIVLLLSLFAGGCTLHDSNAFKKGPYLILPEQAMGMTVLWQLESPAPCTLQWGRDVSCSEGCARLHSYGDNQYQYTISGLAARTRYYYRVSNKSHRRKGSFVTAPAGNTQDPVKFIVHGDIQKAAANYDRVCSGILKTIEEDAGYQTFCLMTGDWIEDGIYRGWQELVFNQKYPSLVRLQSVLPVMGCRGNNDNLASLRKYWPYPFEEKGYYSFTYGPLEVWVLDSEENLSGPQRQWLEEGLKQSDKPWRILVYHKNAYSAGSGNASARRHIHPLAVRYGVAVVFGGHWHTYADQMIDNVLYINTGEGGTTFDGHYCMVEIAEDTLAVTAKRPVSGKMIGTAGTQLPPAVPARAQKIDSISCRIGPRINQIMLNRN